MIKGRGEASSAASPEEKALASEPAPVAPRIPSSSSVAFFLTTEDQTSACTTGSCFGRSRNSRTMSSAAAPEKQLPQHEFPLLRGRASAGNCGPRRGTELLSGAEFNFPHRAERSAGLRLQRLGRDEEDERTFGLHGEMDDFRRLKSCTRLYPTATPREFAESQVFAKAVSARREDGRGSEDRGEDSREDTADGGQAQPASGSEEEGRHGSRHGSTGVLPALSGEGSERRPRGNIWYDRHRVKRHQRGRDSRERHPRDRPSTGPRWDRREIKER